MYIRMHECVYQVRDGNCPAPVGSPSNPALGRRWKAGRSSWPLPGSRGVCWLPAGLFSSVPWSDSELRPQGCQVCGSEQVGTGHANKVCVPGLVLPSCWDSALQQALVQCVCFLHSAAQTGIWQQRQGLQQGPREDRLCRQDTNECRGPAVLSMPASLAGPSRLASSGQWRGLSARASV